MPNAELRCVKCQKKYDINLIEARCTCGEPLQVEYPELTASRGALRKKTPFLLEKYREFFPFTDVDRSAGLGEGNTPLIRSTRVSREIGLKNLYFKNETVNPTWTFKDRGTACGLQHALSLGYRRVGTVSSGNMAASVAAFGTKAGIETFIFLKGNVPREKINPVAIYNPNLFVVKGFYGNLYHKTLEIGSKLGIYFINSDVPFRVEGSKTIGFEVCEQLAFKAPDYIAVSIGSGGVFRGILKGLEEFHRVGFIKKIPRMIGVQTLGNYPVVKAFEAGVDTMERNKDACTLDHVLENPDPPSGGQVVRKTRENGGTLVAVSDEEVKSAQILMGREGLFAQPASTATLAGVRKLFQTGYLKASDSVVSVVTGSGYKYTQILDEHDFPCQTVDIEDLERVVTEKVRG